MVDLRTPSGLWITAVTIPQPWATLHVLGELAYHTRSWYPARYGSAQGLMAIHAGASQVLSTVLSRVLSTVLSRVLSTVLSRVLSTFFTNVQESRLDERLSTLVPLLLRAVLG